MVSTENDVSISYAENYLYLFLDVIFFFLFLFKDFNKKHMEDFGYGEYTPMDVDLLPPLYLIYAENPSDSGKVS